MKTMKPVRAALATAALAIALEGSAVAAEPVDLELMIGVDVSGSVDHYEARLQRDGYVAAFTDPQVIEAIRSGFLGKIAVLYYEWAGWGHNKAVVDWMTIEDEASAKAFAATLAAQPVETAHRTSISEAIMWAIPAFENSPFKGKRRVLDLSGDGANNYGQLVSLSRDAAVAAGITINGLPILDGESYDGYGRPPVPNLDLYYENCVIGGRGAFVIVANGFKDFANAVRRKLVLEIAGRQPDDGGIEARPRRAAPDRFAMATPPRPWGWRGLESVKYWLPLGESTEGFVPPCDAGEQRDRERRNFYYEPY